MNVFFLPNNTMDLSLTAGKTNGPGWKSKSGTAFVFIWLSSMVSQIIADQAQILDTPTVSPQ